MNDHAKNLKSTRGFSLIELIIVVLIIGIITVLAVPNLLKARRAANEASAISSISLIYRSEATYKNSQGNGEYTDLTTLRAAGYIDSVVGNVPHKKSGYEFQVDIFASAPGVDARFDLRARPVIHSLTNNAMGTGSRDFGTTEAGGLFETVDNTPVTFDPLTRIVQGSAVPIDR
ncbi:MAG: prepilin-type N-terminal cleavage/methylation domain-containing protein [Acidobacteriota bacterium]|nr:prepilin-type N-terminal cleavage/methylation domain-containing protein [Acidobacteriota bacterium]MDH3528590.1 prepilin-type N-terminal cleavage/methylation domain-containing protein [Acidobacteriota bacterium]